jgi:hypothetical protein
LVERTSAEQPIEADGGEGVAEGVEEAAGSSREVEDGAGGGMPVPGT